MSSVAPPIFAPAGYVGEIAVSFADTTGAAAVTSAANPLPVSTTILAATSAALTGSASASGSFGPFVPQLGRAIWLTLWGSWTGTVAVQRSIDGGTTKLPITVGGQPWASFTANAQETIGEETASAATYWLAVTLASGTLNYRVSQ